MKWCCCSILAYDVKLFSGIYHQKTYTYPRPLGAVVRLSSLPIFIGNY